MLDWNGWQYYLAMQTHETLGKAASALGVNPTTVTRRLQALEGELGARLFERDHSRFVLTPTGEAIRGAVESLRDAVQSVERTAQAFEGRLEGRIRIACTEAMATRHILPHAKEFERQHRGLELEVITGNEAVSLAERRADVAVRLLRPKEKGLMGRKAGEIRVALYAAEGYSKERHGAAFAPPFAGHAFVGYGSEAAHWPEAKWIAQHAGEAQILARLNSILGVAAAAASGLGLALLPCGIGDEHPDLRRVGDPERGLRREIWLVYHRDLRANPKVRAALEFLTRVLHREGARLRGTQ